MKYIGMEQKNEPKFLYFRTVATDGDDDATGDSALFPVSSLMGMQPTADTSLTIYFYRPTNKLSKGFKYFFC